MPVVVECAGTVRFFGPRLGFQTIVLHSLLWTSPVFKHLLCVSSPNNTSQSLWNHKKVKTLFLFFYIGPWQIYRHHWSSLEHWPYDSCWYFNISRARLHSTWVSVAFVWRLSWSFRPVSNIGTVCCVGGTRVSHTLCNGSMVRWFFLPTDNIYKNIPYKVAQVSKWSIRLCVVKTTNLSTDS